MARYIIELAVCIHMMKVFISMARYILEGNQTVETRIKNCQGIQFRLDTIRQLQKIMEAVSPYAAAFKHMYEDEKEQTTKLGYRAKIS